MKIAILSENFLTDKHKNRLGKLGEVTYYTDTDTVDKARQRLKDVDIAVVDMFLTPITPETLDSANSLKYISLNSTGYDLIDLNEIRKRKIVISHNPGFSTDAVAEHVFALLFAVLRRIPLLDNQIREKPFEMADPAEYAHLASMNLRNKTLGIMGLGTIGKRVSEIGHGLGMSVIAYNRSEKSVPKVALVSKEELLKQSDVVTLHLPLTSDTEMIIGEKELSMMKPNSVLINTARGKHVDNHALTKAIKNQQIYGAGLDVLDVFDLSNPLLELKESVVITPHSAWLTRETLENWAEGVTKNVESFVSGTPINVVS